MTCSVAQCGRSRYCKGLCSMHYLRLRRTGSTGTAARQRAPWGTGYIDLDGYRTLHAASHPLAGAQGKVLEHRVVLYDEIGPGPHPCHWCTTPLEWASTPSQRICVDHLDFNRQNNDVKNLVVSCLDCNTKRTAS